MDATGLVNLESALARLRRDKVFVILAGLQDQPARVLDRAGITPEEGRLALCDSLDAAVGLARLQHEKIEREREAQKTRSGRFSNPLSGRFRNPLSGRSSKPPPEPRT